MGLVAGPRVGVDVSVVTVTRTGFAVKVACPSGDLNASESSPNSNTPDPDSDALIPGNDPNSDTPDPDSDTPDPDENFTLLKLQLVTSGSEQMRAHNFTYILYIQQEIFARLLIWQFGQASDF